MLRRKNRRFPVGAGVDDAWGWGRLRRPRPGLASHPLLPGRRKRPHLSSTPLPPLRNTLRPSSFFPSFFLHLTPIGRNSLRPYVICFVLGYGARSHSLHVG